MTIRSYNQKIYQHLFVPLCFEMCDLERDKRKNTSVISAEADTNDIPILKALFKRLKGGNNLICVGTL